MGNVGVTSQQHETLTRNITSFTSTLIAKNTSQNSSVLQASQTAGDVTVTIENVKLAEGCTLTAGNMIASLTSTAVTESMTSKTSDMATALMKQVQTDLENATKQKSTGLLAGANISVSSQNVSDVTENLTAFSTYMENVTETFNTAVQQTDQVRQGLNVSITTYECDGASSMYVGNQTATLAVSMKNHATDLLKSVGVVVTDTQSTTTASNSTDQESKGTDAIVAVGIGAGIFFVIIVIPLAIGLIIWTMKSNKKAAAPPTVTAAPQ